MAASFPHRYQVSLVRNADTSARLSSAEAPPITGGPPVQFDGPGDVWSPEQMLVGAASLCLLTTFNSFVRKAALPLAGYRCEAEGVLEKTREGLVFTGISLTVTLDVAPEHEAKARELLATAKKYCIISNSLKAPVTLTVHTAAETAISAPA